MCPRARRSTPITKNPQCAKAAAAYEAALCDVFNACKAAAGYPEAQLVVK